MAMSSPYIVNCGESYWEDVFKEAGELVKGDSGSCGAEVGDK